MTEDRKEKCAPFFARFLEEEEYPKVQTDLKAGPLGPWPGPPVVTMKWPSDDDDDPVIL